jgi:hypothetical protein
MGKESWLCSTLGSQVSDLGASPNRITDIYGCGIHVVEDIGAGDLARIIHVRRGGVLL